MSTPLSCFLPPDCDGDGARVAGAGAHDRPGAALRERSCCLQRALAVKLPPVASHAWARASRQGGGRRLAGWGERGGCVSRNRLGRCCCRRQMLHACRACHLWHAQKRGAELEHLRTRRRRKPWVKTNLVGVCASLGARAWPPTSSSAACTRCGKRAQTSQPNVGSLAPPCHALLHTMDAQCARCLTPGRRRCGRWGYGGHEATRAVLSSNLKCT